MNAVAMESANRAYVQQTLNRLKDIATGQAPELIVENVSAEETKTEKVISKKPTTKKKASGEKKPAKKATPKARKPAGNAKEVAKKVVSPKAKKAE
jgi:hypothetical protein